MTDNELENLVVLLRSIDEGDYALGKQICTPGNFSKEEAEQVALRLDRMIRKPRMEWNWVEYRRMHTYIMLWNKLVRCHELNVPEQ